MSEFLIRLLGIIGTPLFIMGLVLITIALFFKNDTSVKSNKNKPPRIGKFTFDPLPDWAFRTLIALGILFAVLGAGQTMWRLTLPGTDPRNGDNFLGVNLASITFETNRWNSRMIDLRTSNQMGIDAPANVSLALSDVQVFAPDTIQNDYFVQVKVWADDSIYLGKTDSVVLASGGITSLGMVVPASFQDPDVENAWKVKDEWKQLRFTLEIQEKKDGDLLASTNYFVRLSDTTDSWYLYPPYASMTSIAYSVNDGSDLVLDLRSAEEDGINVKSGDKLQLKEIWTKSFRDSDAHLVHIEAYTTAGGYDEEALIKSDGMAFKYDSFNLIAGEHFQWIITPDKTSIVITLAREDNALLDRYIIPFKTDPSASLVRADQAVFFSQDEIAYLDFEDSLSLTRWKNGSGEGSFATFTISDQKYFSGRHSLAINVTDDREKTFIIYTGPFTATYIIGQVFWPEQDGITVDWATICLGETGPGETDDCVAIPIKMGQWNTFVFDLSKLVRDGTPQNQMIIPYFYIDGRIYGSSISTPYTFFIDSIQIYPTINP